MSTPTLDDNATLERLQQSVRSQTPESNQSEDNDQESIAKLAYALWQNRGCPIGSSDQDWIEAERQLTASGVQTAAAGR